MKHIFNLIIISFVFGCIIACENNSSNSNVLDSKVDKKILWEMGGHLPAQTGMDKNIGTAGLLHGVLEGKYIVVGGGANFPYEPVLYNGARKTYSDIYLLEDKNGSLEVIEHINWENEIGYGSSITTKDGVYYLGGSPNPEAADDILFITLQNGKLNIEKIGDLPFTLQNGLAVERNGKLYIAGGAKGNGNSSGLYEYDLTSKEIKELSPIPQEAVRQQLVGQILNGNLYVFSGVGNVAYTDGYKYDFDNDTWTKVSDVSLNGKALTVAGGNSIKLNEKEMLVMGGVNKEIFDDAVAKLGTLQGRELANFRDYYFRADPYEFRFNSDILIYNADSDTWRTIGESPFDPNAGAALLLIGNKIYSINGEIKAGVRTDKMFVGTIFAK
mgnify:FL=1